MEHHSQPDERKAQILLIANRVTPVQVAARRLAASAQLPVFPKWNQPVRLWEFSAEISNPLALFASGLV
jgi:hypothetical protein